MTAPSTFSEVAATVVDDLTWSDPLFVWGYLRGHLDSLDVLGIDTNPDPDPAWLTAYFTRQRAEVRRARQYTRPPKTAAQIAAEVAWSWRTTERVA